MTTSSKKIPRIFVSHSHIDNDFGIKLARNLRHILNDDSAVWYDIEGGLYGGDTWWRKIVEEITARNVFIVVLSPDAMGSPWVNDEIDLAWRLKNTPPYENRIIPVLHRQCEVRADLASIQSISFLPPKKYEAAINELLLALGVSTYVEPLKTKEEYVNEGILHRKAKRYKEALAAFNHALELDPNDPYTYGRRADIYRALREYEQALQDFDRAFELDPESATAWAYATRGRVYDGMKQYQRAFDDFDRAYQLAPTDPWVKRWRNETIEKLKKQEEKHRSSVNN